ncbi:Part of AAA domain-containing protein [Sinosporangium album]|uniref:Part of AAA domain-containing protein n=1 Tax=Sinosporangium album TaxID=504805 RepID=A0A1G8B5J9_9ACTN|nr:AAA domain-containing protein [Sinosporangium album]SDH28532.1 Part of AAA domain-containing protein [Sinosporangium album]
MTPRQAAEAATAAILADYTGGGHRGLVVDSPPGAGKTTLVVATAMRLAEAGRDLMVVAQTNEQVDDLVDRLAGKAPGVSVGRLHKEGFQPPERVTRHSNVTLHNKVDKVQHCQVVVATADKWAYVSGRTWPWAIVDEAYQMRSDKLLAVAPLFADGHTLFVGDPGQLDPFSVVDSERWTGLAWDPMQSAVAVTQRLNDLAVHRLPVSWRLPATAAPVIADAFYPASPFVSGTAHGERRLSLSPAAARDPHDAALEEAASSGWALHELPPRHTVRTDPETAAACAALARRVLERGTTAHDEYGFRPVTPDRVAVGCAHNDQVAAVRQAGVPDGVTVDTANRLQGREYDVTIVWHPLSGRRDATAFHLESGRLCVLASRHRHACLVVARAGIADLLDNHPSSLRVQLNVPVKFPDGWAANQAILAHLARHRVPG